MSEAVHVASGRSASSTRSTTSACCSSRATASRPSTSSCRPRSPTRAACSPASPASGSRARGTSSRTTCSRIRDDGRSIECRRLEMLPIECVVRGYLAGSGWKDYRATRRGLRAPAAGGAQESDKLPEPIFTPGDEGGRPGTTRTSRASRRPSSSARSGSREVERISLALYSVRGRLRARARDHHRRHEVRARPRRATARSCSATRR